MIEYEVSKRIKIWMTRESIEFEFKQILRVLKFMKTFSSFNSLVKMN